MLAASDSLLRPATTRQQLGRASCLGTGWTCPTGTSAEKRKVIILLLVMLTPGDLHSLTILHINVVALIGNRSSSVYVSFSSIPSFIDKVSILIA